MEKLSNFLDKTLGFCQESSIPEDHIYFGMKKAESLIKTDALVQYPCFFIVNFCISKLQHFCFKLK
jgi:hypothetical protein